MKERFLSGKDEYYGNWVEDVWISDEPEEIELLNCQSVSVKDKHAVEKKSKKQHRKFMSAINLRCGFGSLLEILLEKDKISRFI